jgi:hypothetical protein
MEILPQEEKMNDGKDKMQLSPVAPRPGDTFPRLRGITGKPIFTTDLSMLRLTINLDNPTLAKLHKLRRETSNGHLTIEAFIAFLLDKAADDWNIALAVTK